MPFDPTYEINDDTISICDLARAPGSGSDFIKDGETGTVIALGSGVTPDDFSEAARRALGEVQGQVRQGAPQVALRVTAHPPPVPEQPLKPGLQQVFTSIPASGQDYRRA
jgi:hypothetical protein